MVLGGFMKTDIDKIAKRLNKREKVYIQDDTNIYPINIRGYYKISSPDNEIFIVPCHNPSIEKGFPIFLEEIIIDEDGDLRIDDGSKYSHTSIHIGENGGWVLPDGWKMLDFVKLS